MNKEIEKKYSIKNLPDDIEIVKIQDIQQAFIYRDTKSHIRLRKLDNRKAKTTQYVYTVKTKGDISYNNDYNIARLYEIESYISKDEYEDLIQKRIANMINKTRINVPIENDFVVEIDIYYDYLEGLITAEIEFPDEETAKSFKKPDWLGEELGYKTFSNGKLSLMNREQFMNNVTDEFMENNKIIIEKLKKLI